MISMRCVSKAWLVAACVACPTIVLAQGWTPPPPVQQRWPDDPPTATTPQPAPQSAPKVTRRAKPKQAEPVDQVAEPTAPAPAAARAAPKKQAQPARAIACSGTFAKESGHLKLATAFDSRNVVFTDVDGPDGAKLKASVLFPTDPKRRLEVLWQNEAARADTALIVINGQSTWTAPKGLKLGLPLAALEKLNGKPFKLSGFDQENAVTVSDWQDGALASLPGGCKVGIRLMMDAKASETARTAVAGKAEFMSNDGALRGVSPKIGEILIGY